jgi:arylsulfatase A-like enzyme
MNRKLPIHKWYDRLLVALALASVVGVIWSVEEALSVHHSSVGFLQLWRATGVAAGIVTAISTLVAAALAVILQHPKVGPAIIDRLPKGGLLQWGLFLMLISFGSLLLLWLFQTVFASAEVHRLALALTFPAFVLLAAGFAKYVGPVAKRCSHAAPTRSKSPRALGAFAVIVFFAWLTCLGAIAPEVIVNLNPRDLLPIFATFIAAWLGALFLPAKRWIYLSAAPCVALLLGLSLSFAVAEYTNEARIAVSRTTHGAKLVHWQLTRLQMDKGQIGKRSGSCYNGVPATAAKDIGAVRPGAPDIVLLLVDGLQWNHTSMGGYERNTTPNLRELGKKAAVFRAYAPATSTRQSIRSLFTGVFPSQVKAPSGTKWGVTLAKGQQTLASLLRAAGYETVAIDMTKGVFRNRYNALHGFDRVDIQPYKYVKKKGYSTPNALERVRAHLNRPRVDNKPRFIWVQLMDTHPPFPGGPKPVSYGKSAMAKYDAAIHFVDQELKATIDFLNESKRADKTFLLVSADHGCSFHEGRRVRTDVYDSGIQVPLMIWGPTVKGKRYRQRVSLLDVYATIFGIAGVAAPSSTCGFNLLPDVIQGKEPFPYDVYAEQIPDQTRAYFDVAFIRGDMKLILRPSQGVRELYNLKKDPKERNNLAEKSPRELSDITNALRQYYMARNFSPDRYGL